MLTASDHYGDIHILKLAAKTLSSDQGRHLSHSVLSEMAGEQAAVLIDLSSVKRLENSGIALLLSLQQARAAVGFFGLKPGPARRLHDMEFDAVLNIFESRQEALTSDWARGHLLTSRSAVILCAGTGSRCRPLTHDVPKPMLDVLGRPVLDRLIRFIKGYGVNRFLLNPGHLGPQIHDHFGDGGRIGAHVSYYNEGRYDPFGWQAQPLGSASSLARLHARHSAFEKDTFVFCGDALIDLDLAAMLDVHRRTGAMATLAAQTVPQELVSRYGILQIDDSGRVQSFQEKPHPDSAKSRLANTGIYIFSPEALSLLPDRPNLDIAEDLLPAILRVGGRIQAFSDPFDWTDIGCAQDYFGANVQALAQAGNGIMAEDGAVISPKADLSGPVYVGVGATVSRGAKIVGPAVIGRGCVVEGNTMLKNSILMPRTRLLRGGAVTDLIASAHWAVSHPLADGRDLSAPPVDLVCSVDDAHSRQQRPESNPVLRAVG